MSIYLEVGRLVFFALFYFFIYKIFAYSSLLVINISYCVTNIFLRSSSLLVTFFTYYLLASLCFYLLLDVNLHASSLIFFKLSMGEFLHYSWGDLLIWLINARTYGRDSSLWLSTTKTCSSFKCILF